MARTRMPRNPGPISVITHVNPVPPTEVSSSSSNTSQKQKKPCSKNIPRKYPPRKQVARVSLTTVPDGFAVRLEKSIAQRLYLVDIKPVIVDSSNNFTRTYITLGSTGNKYTTTISTICTCSCVDFVTRKQSCKHILFIKHKVLKIAPDNPIIWNTYLTKQQLETIFQKEPVQDIDTSVFAPKNVRNAVAEDSGAVPYMLPGESETTITVDEKNNFSRKPFIGTDCPICFSKFNFNESAVSVLWCVQCGQSIHVNCMNIWYKSFKQNDKTVTCPHCARNWTHWTTEFSFEGDIKPKSVSKPSTHHFDPSVTFHTTFQNYSKLLDSTSTSTSTSLEGETET